MISKSRLIKGGWYIGISRNSQIAVWDGEKFRYLNKNFDKWHCDSIEHYSDTTNEGFDGFVPVSKVTFPQYKMMEEEKNMVDYKGWYRNIYLNTTTELKGEIWESLKDYDGYEVSNLGRVRNKNKVILKQSFNRGYLVLGLKHVDGTRKNRRVHRLVATTFCKTPQDGKSEVDHINNIKTDNRAVNLRWVSRSENAKNMYANGFVKRKLSIYDVDIIRKELSSGEKTHREIAEMFNVSQSIISEIKNGTKWNH